jgi:hypothetical protein
LVDKFIVLIRFEFTFRRTNQTGANGELSAHLADDPVDNHFGFSFGVVSLLQGDHLVTLPGIGTSNSRAESEDSSSRCNQPRDTNDRVAKPRANIGDSVSDWVAIAKA